MGDYLLLIDGSSLLTTQFFGNLPPEVMFAKTDEEKAKHFDRIMKTSGGVYTNAVFGFMRTLIRILNDQRPRYLAVAWDMSRNTFRRELYPDYKGNRSETMLPLASQFSLCIDVLGRLGVSQFMSDRYEADDYCGTLSLMFENETPVKILTKDNDYLQLVSDRTSLWMMHATAKKTEELYKKYRLTLGSAPERCFEFTPELVKKEFGIEPMSVPDLKGLQGDTSDNIKGVPGVGPATATALIAKYGTIEALYEAMEGLDEAGLKALAASWKEIGVSRSPVGSLLKEDGDALVGHKAAVLSKRLATIERHIDLGGLSLSDLKVRIDKAEAVRIFGELEFRSLKPEFPSYDEDEDIRIPERTIETISDLFDVEDFAGVLKHSELAGIAPAISEGRLFGLAVTIKPDSSVFIPCEGFVTPDMLISMIADADREGTVIAVHDLKRLLKAAPELKPVNMFDVMTAAYLADPVSGCYDPVSIASMYCEKTKYGGRSSLGKLTDGEAYITLHDEYVTTLCGESAVYAETCPKLRLILEGAGLIPLYRDIEMPLSSVLAGMESMGVLVDTPALEKFAAELDSDIRRIEERIFGEVGEPFNINSPKQLGVILFERLKLPYYGKKMKTGYSTSADVLEQLRPEHPVINDILEYRKLTKLKSTYADGLRGFIDSDGRIRTTFNQTVTATGRLSSTEPNLQNIPVRTEMGRLIRKAFVPQKGYVFVDADYSQIELRILAALSGDEKLIAAYRNSEDIHRATASAVFHVPFEDVTPELRRRAKAVNFGIVYGMSFFGLGNELGIGFDEAKQYISDYYDTYPGIRDYLKKLVTDATESGYSSTLYGRRRRIPELSSSNYQQRQLGERIAMNTPIQGTAADIIKIAMIRVDERLKKETPSSRLILQIHDELLVEAREEDAGRVAEILTEEMESAASLSVRLVAEVERGYNWDEAH